MESIKEVEWKHVFKRGFDNLPENSAVYVIVAYTDSDKNVVIYSGQTDNIKERCNDHWSESEPNKKLKNIIKNYGESMSVFYALVHGLSLDGHEKFLFETFKPQAQERAPDVEPKPISLDGSFVKGKIKEECFEDKK